MGSRCKSRGQAAPKRRRLRNNGRGKKALKQYVRGLRKKHPNKKVEVWTEDETRLGLKPITRRVWALKGQRPVSNGQTRYRWMYVYGFAEPKTGKLFHVFMPRVKLSQTMSVTLSCAAAGISPMTSASSEKTIRLCIRCRME